MSSSPATLDELAPKVKGSRARFATGKCPSLAAFLSFALFAAITYGISKTYEVRVTDHFPLSHLKLGHDHHHSFNNDIVLTFKTGSAVLFSRVPTWLLDLSAAKAMPCHRDGWSEYIPNQAYYSDAEITLGDVTFRDALSNVSDYVRGMDDFQEYFRVHESLSKRVDPAVIAKSASHEPIIPKGWALDKFKFLPLHGDAYRRWPDAKWHVSIEDDTFIFWNQLIKWLRKQDHDAHKLYGNPTLLVNGSLPFAHGGSVYAISKGLLKATYGRDPWGFERQWDHYLRYSCCGDAELSRALRLATNSTAIPNFEESKFKFQADSLAKVKLDVRDLCQPIFSLHHVTPFEYSQLRMFKRAVDRLVTKDDYIRYVDLWDWMMPTFLNGKIFTGVERDRAPAPRQSEQWHHQVGWRAIARDDVQNIPDTHTEDGCRDACRARPICLLYTFDKTSRSCKLADDLYIGTIDTEGDRYTSGYHLGRIDEIRRRHDCAGRLGDLGQLSRQSIKPALIALGGKRSAVHVSAGL